MNLDKLSYFTNLNSESHKRGYSPLLTIHSENSQASGEQASVVIIKYQNAHPPTFTPEI